MELPYCITGFFGKPQRACRARTTTITNNRAPACCSPLFLFFSAVFHPDCFSQLFAPYCSLAFHSADTLLFSSCLLRLALPSPIYRTATPVLRFHPSLLSQLCPPSLPGYSSGASAVRRPGVEKTCCHQNKRRKSWGGELFAIFAHT